MTLTCYFAPDDEQDRHRIADDLRDGSGRLVIAWDVIAVNGSRSGGHDIVGRRPYGDAYACPRCIDKLRHGTNPRHENLL